MAHAAHPETMTVDEFLVYGAQVKWSELVRGRVRVYEPASSRHGSVEIEVILALGVFVERHDLGALLSGDTGFDLPNLPDTVRAPDVAFVSKARIPAEGFGSGFGRLAPDLAVEILSPSQTAWQMNEKMEDYFTAGTRLVWVIDPVKRTVMVQSYDGPPRWLHEGDVLDGGDVVPGFGVPVGRLFRHVARAPDR